MRAVEQGRIEAFAPELLYAEVAHALVRYGRANRLSEGGAQVALLAVMELPIRTIALRELAVPALQLASNQRVSVYDACYLVLAERAEATLVTADRRLAEVAPRAALLPGATPP